MAITYTYTDLDTVKSDTDFTVKQYLADNNIFIDYNTSEGRIPQSWNFGLSNGLWQIARQTVDVIQWQGFPQRATIEYLEAYHGNEFSVSRRTSTEARGNIIFEGTVGATVPLSTQIIVNETSYETTQSKAITTIIVDVTTIVVAGGIATVTLDQDIDMGSGMSVSILGATPSDLNVVDQAINATSNSTFTFASAATPGAATGTITATFTYVSIEVISIGTGSDFNLANNTTLALTSPVANIEDECFVEFNGIINGTDTESDENYRDRILFVTQNIPQGLNRANVEVEIKSFDNDKYADAKVFTPRAERTDGVVEGGYTTIYFLKAGNVLPTSGELSEIKTHLLDTIYQVYTLESKLNVVAPVQKFVTVQIALDSGFNTLTMQTAVNEAVQELFLDDSTAYFRTTLLLKAVDQKIRATYDSNGVFLEDNYTLNLPSSDTTVAYNEFPFLNGGSVVFV